MSTNRYDVFQQNTKPPQHLFSALLGDATLLYVTDAQFNTDWHSLMHTHPNMELFYCMRGIGEFQMKDQVVPVGSDDLIIVNSNVEHTECSVSTNPLEYIVLGISGVDFIFDSVKSQFAVLNYRQSRTEITSILRMLVSEAKHQSDDWLNVCQHLLVVLFSLVFRHSHFSLTIDENSCVNNKECAAAKRYIDEHFHDPIDLSLLSDITHINKYYLSHAFKKEYGISPINYLIERRIRESQYLLEHTDYTLSQIAHILGFSSASYFSQSFRRSTSQSPTEYRKEHRKMSRELPDTN